MTGKLSIIYIDNNTKVEVDIDSEFKFDGIEVEVNEVKMRKN